MSESFSFMPPKFNGFAKGDMTRGGQITRAPGEAQPIAAHGRQAPVPNAPFDPDASQGEPANATFRRTATRADLLDAVYAACPSLSRHQARDIFEMALDEVSGALTRGESVKLRAFGLFTVREKRERIGRNPRTGQEVPIKPRRVLTFKASPVLLDHVNGREAKDED